MIRRPPRSTQSRSSAASDVYKRQHIHTVHGTYSPSVAAAATLPLVSEEVASAPAPSDMAQGMMCVSWLCVDAALFRRDFSVYCGIAVPYSAALMCQLVDALRLGHVGACLPTIWYVPVHLLPYHRGIDPSETSHRAAYCLQQRCLVRPCVVFTNSCLLYTSPSPRDLSTSRMPSSA